MQQVGVVAEKVENSHLLGRQQLTNSEVFPVVSEGIGAVKDDAEIKQEQCAFQARDPETEKDSFREHERDGESRRHDDYRGLDQFVDWKRWHGHGRYALLWALTTSRNAASELRSSDSSAKHSSMRMRALLCMTSAAPGRISISPMLSMAAAKADGLPASTTSPYAPTMRAESPTSVTTHGRPHAIASATVFGKPSPLEVDASMSNALYTARISSCGPAL